MLLIDPQALGDKEGVAQQPRRLKKRSNYMLVMLINVGSTEEKNFMLEEAKNNYGIFKNDKGSSND